MYILKAWKNQPFASNAKGVGSSKWAIMGIRQIDAVGEIMVKPRATEKVASSSEHASCQKANSLPESGSWHKLSRHAVSELSLSHDSDSDAPQECKLHERWFLQSLLSWNIAP